MTQANKISLLLGELLSHMVHGSMMRGAPRVWLLLDHITAFASSAICQTVRYNTYSVPISDCNGEYNDKIAANNMLKKYHSFKLKMEQSQSQKTQMLRVTYWNITFK